MQVSLKALRDQRIRGGADWVSQLTVVPGAWACDVQLLYGCSCHQGAARHKPRSPGTTAGAPNRRFFESSGPASQRDLDPLACPIGLQPSHFRQALPDREFRPQGPVTGARYKGGNSCRYLLVKLEGMEVLVFKVTYIVATLECEIRLLQTARVCKRFDLSDQGYTDSDIIKAIREVADEACGRMSTYMHGA